MAADWVVSEVSGLSGATEVVRRVKNDIVFNTDSCCLHRGTKSDAEREKISCNKLEVSEVEPLDRQSQRSTLSLEEFCLEGRLVHNVWARALFALVADAIARRI